MKIKEEILVENKVIEDFRKEVELNQGKSFNEEIEKFMKEYPETKSINLKRLVEKQEKVIAEQNQQLITLTEKNESLQNQLREMAAKQEKKKTQEEKDILYYAGISKTEEEFKKTIKGRVETDLTRKEVFEKHNIEDNDEGMGEAQRLGRE